MTKRTLVWLSALASPFGTLGCQGQGDNEPVPPPVAVEAALEQTESGAHAEPALPPDPLVEPPTGGPTVNVWPAHGARFMRGARFDIRVEGTGTGPDYGYLATLAIDGVTKSFSSGSGDSNLTDGITVTGWGGFNLRGYSNQKPGVHEIDATFTSSQGTKRVRSFFVIEKLETLNEGHRVNNVIMLLGDGMGIDVRTAARIARFGMARGTTRGWLEMDRFPATGMATTSSLNNYLTDSAPGFAAYSTGTHNNNEQEGVFPAQVTNPFYQPRVENMAEYLHRTQGKVTGIVTTADVEDATPGAMGVHTGNRNAGTGITDQFLDEADVAETGTHGTGLRVLMGGGRKWFIPAGTAGSGRTAATDYPALPADLVAAWSLPSGSAGALDTTRDLITDFTTAGFTYASSATELAATMAGPLPSKLLGLFHLGNMNVAVDKLAKRRGVPVDGAVDFANSFVPPKSPYAVDNDGFPDQPMLDEMADAAIKVLSQNDKGFVMLIEGASIDKQEHAQDADRTIGDALEFDRAVGVARRFAEHDKHTLVLVLADHTCAGFVAMGGLKNPSTNSNAGSLAYLQSLPADTNVLDPAVQPERQKVVGTNFGTGGFPKYDVLPDGYPANFNVDGKMLVGFGASADRYERWLTRPLPGPDGLGTWDKAAGMFVRGQGLKSGNAPHGGSDVPVSAYAADDRVYGRFVGTMENIDVFFRAMATVGAGTR
ncbi:MAG TPA: alkaline phosphatase [Polyangia bacterium]|nr:alkaline phosphatase [Polyangia bacterium]